ncbi:MAG: hypothetical protein NT165_03885 [Candidatus Falkowbacteria bacterium]|nr:hypothetical protein [Candidatus Falkowbacteria bacterium]
MDNYTFYALNILLFALPLALFEINLEKTQGWGGGFPRDKWYGKSSLKGTWIDKILTSISRFESPLNYHLVIMFLFLAVFVLEYLFATKNIFLLLSCFFGVNFFADLSWFSFNWYFDSMRQLLKGPNGSITWHKSWLKIGKTSYIPATYLWWLGLSVLFMVLARIW